ncbi:MAG: heme exporter protein CcmD [Dokdonella sp.]|uniref:heme exporter protein CcmD n=1 Tax=Dokdonella sp. TaxID=2291710 RepID=UPI0025C6C47E|nr:heme exporter protein CcmD [Dokdonella sp.]MBZ0223862.1 heme exporter protein CcmD [Dokdonella sp.]
MHSFFAMGGYAAYVWVSYAVFIVVLAIDAWAARAQRLRQLAQVRGRARRSAARSGSTP